MMQIDIMIMVIITILNLLVFPALFSFIFLISHINLKLSYFDTIFLFFIFYFFVLGGIGKGVSLLTLDSQFYRDRARRRVAKVRSVSEGVYVGKFLIFFFKLSMFFLLCFFSFCSHFSLYQIFDFLLFRLFFNDMFINILI